MYDPYFDYNGIKKSWCKSDKWIYELFANYFHGDNHDDLDDNSYINNGGNNGIYNYDVNDNSNSNNYLINLNHYNYLDAAFLRDSSNGIGLDDENLIEIICTRSNAELQVNFFLSLLYYEIWIQIYIICSSLCFVR